MSLSWGVKACQVRFAIVVQKKMVIETKLLTKILKVKHKARVGNVNFSNESNHYKGKGERNR
jgi:hypothetical protein